MTILPNKRNGNSSKENEKNDSNNSGTSLNSNGRHNRGLLSSSQLLIQDNNSVGNQNHAHTSYSEDLSKFRPSHVGHLYKEESAPASPGAGSRSACRTYSRERASKRKSRDHLEHSSTPKTNVSPSLPYQTQASDDTSSNTVAINTERNNSEDEYEPMEITNEEWEARDRDFYDLMRKKGFVVKTIEEDGACLFRAIADQIYGNEDMHSIVRHNCMDYIMQNRDFFSEYITEDINRYVSRKRNDFVHGNHLEIQALSEMYNRTIEVYCYSEEPINIFLGHYKHGYEPIRLSYQRGSHYNSIRDPYTASIGVGLGLPNYQPGEADRKLLKDASSANELILIEQAMIQDKIAATDWEATNDAILEQATRESLALYMNDPVAGCSSTSDTAKCGSSTASNVFTTSRLSSFPSSSSNNNCTTGLNYRQQRCRLPSPTTVNQRLLAATNTPSTSPSTSTNSRHRTSTSPQSSCSSTNSLQLQQQQQEHGSRCTLINNNNNNNNNTPRQTSSSTSVHSAGKHLESSPSTSNHNFNEDTNNPVSSEWSKENHPCMQMPPEIFGISGWEDDAAILSRVLAESQKEYLESLKQNRNNQSDEDYYDDVNKPGPSSSAT